MGATILVILAFIVLHIGPLVLAGYVVYINDWSFWWYLPVLAVIVIGKIALILSVSAVREMMGSLPGFNRKS